MTAPRGVGGLALVAAAACVAAAAHAAHAAPADDVPTRSCGSRAEVRAPLTRLAQPNDVVVGPVAFSGLKLVATPRGLAPHRGPDGIYAVKAAAKVRAGLHVTVAIGFAARETAWLAFHRGVPSPATGTSAVRFEACPRNTPAFAYRGVVGPVTAFPGGFAVAERACVPITVTVERTGRTYRRLVPFGRSC